MESRNTFLLRDTESFMRGELDNLTISNGFLMLDYVQGAYVPYGCYTSPAIPMPTFDALRVSWNASAPPNTAVEAQARVLVDGNWTPWVSFGRWSPYLRHEGPSPVEKGPLLLRPDVLLLDSKVATQAQLRIYLYTNSDKVSPSVCLLGASSRPVNVIPGGGRPVNKQLHLMPYAMARRAPSLKPWMDLAIGLCSLTNRWGADLLPEEFAQVLRDYRPADDADPRNLCFAAAAAGCWGFPAWVCYADLGLLRAEARAGYGALLRLASTPAAQAAGVPEQRFVTLRGFAAIDGSPVVLLCDPWAAGEDLACEVQMPLDEFLVAWDNCALLMRERSDGPLPGWPSRCSGQLYRAADGPADLYEFSVVGERHPLPDDFCEAGGVLAVSARGETVHATTAHRAMQYIQPQQGGVVLPASEQHDKKYTVYAIEPTGRMLVGDVTV